MSNIRFEEGKLGETTLEINWEAVKHNLHYFRNKLSPTTGIMLMVKANAYGSGAVGVSKLAEQDQLADYLGVTNIDEGIELRNAGVELPIMLQTPNSRDWKLIVEHCLEPEIHNLELLTSFTHFLKGEPSISPDYPIHLKFNTGMNRLGIDKDEMNAVIAMLKNEPSWQIKSIMTHLSSTGNVDHDDFTREQIESFESIQKELEPHLKNTPIFHALNTDGIERHTSAQFGMVRTGIGIYGGSSNANLKSALKAATTLKTTVISCRRVKKGSSISYSRSGWVEEDSNIAVLSIGYADGFPIRLGNGKWQIEINGKLYPTIGVVCMDLCMVNLGEDEVQTGDEAIIFGGQLSLFDYAEALGTISYEALTNISSRVKKAIVDH